MCARHLLTNAALADRHLTMGLYHGLRCVYYPEELPPCVRQNGDIQWHHAAAEAANPEAVA